jgi:Holliday junction resolvasome RuvABC ATP-dependent DNA helicase subunit
VYRFGDGSALPLSPITIVGATTDPDRLLSPMLDRFTYTVRLRLYTVDELAAIAARAAVTLGFHMTASAANAVARASEGTPRIAIKMTRVLRDYAHVLTAATFAEWQSVSGASAGVTAAGADRTIALLGPGPWVTNADVNALLAEPALLWQLEGRDASGRSA